MAGSEISLGRNFWMGLAYAIKPWRFLQLGAGLGFGIRGGSFSQLVILMPEYTGIAYTPGVDLVSGEATLLNMFFQVGAIVEPLPSLRFGISFIPPHLRLLSSGSIALIRTSPEPQKWSESFRLQLDGVEYSWRVPFQISIGVAYTIKERYTLSTDVRVHGPVDPFRSYDHPELSGHEASAPLVGRDTVAKVSVGGDLHRRGSRAPHAACLLLRGAGWLF